jgi:hypothetical protein
MSFQPQSLKWPGKRAVLFVHGIGDASHGAEGAFPLDAFEATMGADAADFAIYRFNYDFINDWAAGKAQAAVLIARARDALKIRFGGDLVAEAIAEYGGDVIWPVLSTDIRLAIRDAFIAQLIQVHLDRGEAAQQVNADPLDYGISIIAHSLGCFHTYEVLWTVANDPRYKLRPATDNFRLQAVVLMASPVQLIRTIGRDIQPLVPALATLATLSEPLALPAEHVGPDVATIARRFVSVTGTQDPVGGYLLGQQQQWGYMTLAGQESVLDHQVLGAEDPRAALISVLHGGGSAGAAGASLHVENPHSWERYVSRNGAALKSALG